MKQYRPPVWTDVFRGKAKELASLLISQEVQAFVAKANEQYFPWDEFRHKPLPPALSNHEIAWSLVKLGRRANREILTVTDGMGGPFSFFFVKNFLRDLSYIDSYAAGSIVTLEGVPSGSGHDNLVINGLIEEAISSSQIEGANTTRRAAKAMIEFDRTPKSRDERMVLNNYRAMARLKSWKDRELDDEFLLELHKILVTGTMDEEADTGRFRSDTDKDAIAIVDRQTGEMVFEPPNASIARKILEQLYEFANSTNDSVYLHPFIKASILHFCIGYIHPFVDGNGRCARALFYWYLLKKNYWMFQYLPISLQIKKNRVPYDRTFLQVEGDESDLTYFLSYKLKLARSAIEDLIKYLQRERRKASLLKESLVAEGELNERQIEIIGYFQKHPALELDLQSYVSKFKVVYQTARTDLGGLVKQGILAQRKSGKKYLYSRGQNFPAS